MGILTFQAAAGGALNLNGPNIAGTVNLTLPSADGTSGQPLQTNGSGTLSFANLAIANGGTGTTSFTANQIHYGSFSQSAGLTFDGTNFATTGTASATKLIPTGTSVTGNGMYLPAVNSVGISTAGINAVYIDASQNVGIGTSSPSSYGKLVSVTGDNVTTFAAVGATNMLRVQGYNSTYVGTVLEAVNLAQSANTPMFINASQTLFGISGAERMRIDTSGGLILVGSTAQKATGTTWSNPSDQRLKDNIRDYAKGITELMQVRVREWEYNGKGGTVEGTKGLGVVADEIMVVLPNTVENYEAKLNTEDEEVTAIKKFDATEITWLLVKTVQEQQALITTLTARIEALEAK